MTKHFHIWKEAASGQAMFRDKKPYRTRQAAAQKATRDGVPARVLKCNKATCLLKATSR